MADGEEVAGVVHAGSTRNDSPKQEHWERERGSDGEFGWPLRAAKEGFTLPTPWLTAMVVLDVVARAQGSTISHGFGQEGRGEGDDLTMMKNRGKGGWVCWVEVRGIGGSDELSRKFCSATSGSSGEGTSEMG